MPKDSCNNMEKNKILRLHDDGKTVPEIAGFLRLTERIVESMISHYRPDSNTKVEKKVIDTDLNDSADETAADEFDDTDED